MAKRRSGENPCSRLAFVTALSVVTMSILATVWAGGREIVGQVVLVTGELKVSGNPAFAGTTLFSGDTVATGASPAFISLTSGRKLQLGAFSEVLLVQQEGEIVVQSPSGAWRQESSDAVPVVQLARGSQQFNSGRRASPKGPPFDPPGPPPEQPPFEPPGPPPERGNPPGRGAP